MKLHRLELTGFGPFRETQTVDFDAFDADGVFLITGRTGAGKSSILDGVSFALYGSVPRYAGGEKRLRSDHCYLDDPTHVVLEFTAADQRWRITRSPDYTRPAKRGGGLTTEKARAVLEVQVGGEWVGRAARPTDVANELDGILGLTAKQFQQVILLAQNQFSRFLLADNVERQQLLRTLFGTRRFDRYKSTLDERRKAADQQLATAGEQVRMLLDLAEAVIDENSLGGEHTDEPVPVEISARQERAATALQRSTYRVEACTTGREAAAAAADTAAVALATARERARRRDELDTSRRRLDELESATAAIDEDRAMLAQARAAEALRAPLEGVERAEAALAVSQRGATDAEAAWQSHGGDANVDPASVLDDVNAELGRSRDALDAEAELLVVTAEVDAHADDARRLRDDLATIEAQRGKVPAERTRREDQRDAARAAAAQDGAVRERRDVLVLRLAAARDAEELVAEVNTAEAAHLDAVTTAATASAAHADVLRRRFSGYAGELAQGLVDGEPCAVCGAVEHPHPAPLADDAVTDDDVTAAETALDAATSSERATRDAARAARERWTAARARAGASDGDVTAAGGEALVSSLSADVEKADAELAVAEQAAAEVARLTAELADLAALDDAARVEQEQLTASLADVQVSHAAGSARRDALRRDVDTARGDHATVAARVHALEGLRDRARVLRDARADTAERERAVAAAREDCASRLAASVFADAAAATAALRTDAVREALDAKIAEHAAALTATRARLLELELAASGDDESVVDIAAAEAAAAAADTARTAAIAAVRDAENIESRLRDLLTRADDAYRAVAALTADAEAVRRLADTVAGRAPNTMKMELETFVLAAELEEIVTAANLRLGEMSSGRYSLHHSDARQARGAASGLSIEVLDEYTGKLRSPQSLSGGETFLASLALALGLAEVVTGRAGGLRLDTLFIDEGFGSLDPDTLELAMRTLDDLRAGGRTVGVISHVEAMKEQLPAQLEVEGTADGPSIIRQQAVPAF